MMRTAVAFAQPGMGTSSYHGWRKAIPGDPTKSRPDLRVSSATPQREGGLGVTLTLGLGICSCVEVMVLPRGPLWFNEAGPDLERFWAIADGDQFFYGLSVLDVAGGDLLMDQGGPKLEEWTS
jgi:hypothetical protein